MHMKKIILLFIAIGTLHSALYADDDCLPYKVSPKVVVTAPEWKKEVVQPLKPMDLLHGNVIATLIENYSLEADSEAIEDGYCVVLTRVNATVGYDDFLVQIDSRHVPDSCGYNVTAAHEDRHIAAHLSVMDDMSGEIKRSITDAANSVMPVFVRNAAEADAALDKMNTEIQNNPGIILMQQKIKAAEEIRNKKIDQNDDGSQFNKCGIM